MASCCCCARELHVVKPSCRCGGHVPWQGSLLRTLEMFPCRCIQMFWGSPQTYKVTKVSTEDRERSREYCLANDRTFYVHAPYCCNLAKPVNENERAIGTMRQLLEQVNDVPGAVVAHIGFGKEVLMVAETINQLEVLGVLRHSNFDRVPFHFLLECASGKKNHLGHTWQDLHRLYEALDKSKVGLCIDTQHAFSAGMSKFENYEDVVRVWDASEAINGHGISMLHLNDSLVSFGDGADRHAPLGTGHIWGSRDNGLQAIIRIARDSNLDLISETSDVMSDIAIVRRYAE